MAGGTINGSTNNTYISAAIDWVAKPNTAGNYSDVTATLKYKKSSSSTASTRGTLSGGIAINGNVKNYSVGVTLSANNTWVGIVQHTLRVYHDANGKASIGISGTGGISGTTFTSTSVGTTVTLDTIPRAPTMDELTTSNDKLSATYTYKWTPKSASFYNRLRVSIPNVKAIKYINIGQKAASQQTNTFVFTAAEMTDMMQYSSKTSEYIKIGIVMEAYSDSNYSTKIGESSELMQNMRIQDKYVPTISSLKSTLVGKSLNSNYVRLNSQCKINFSASIPDNSNTELSKCTITGDDGTNYSQSLSGTSETVEYTTNTINKSGTVTYTVTVYDARNRSTSQTFDITVEDYELPSVTLVAYRCDSTGKRDDAAGNYIHIGISYTVSSTMKSASLHIDNVQKASGFSSSFSKDYGEYSLGTSHEIVVSITDNMDRSITNTVTIQVAALPIVISDSKNAMGFGGAPADEEGSIKFGWDIKVKHGTSEYVSLIDLLHPVGSQIYNSSKTFDPNTYYPGTTWTRIKGNVLAGVNEDDTDTDTHISFNQNAGTVIGSKYLQSHNHTAAIKATSNEAKDYGLTSAWGFRDRVIITSGTDQTGNITTLNGGTGNGQNIQPTQLTYIWERTA